MIDPKVDQYIIYRPEETMTAGVLFSEMDPGPGHESEFDDWYQTEHIPARLALEGFSHAFRSVRLGAGTRNSACYLISDMAVLDTPEYHALKDQADARTQSILSSAIGFTRFTGALIDSHGEPTSDTKRVLVGRASGEIEARPLISWLRALGSMWSGVYRIVSASEPEVGVLAIAGFEQSASGLDLRSGRPTEVAHCGLFALTHWASR